jgi:hypothetical protein
MRRFKISFIALRTGGFAGLAVLWIVGLLCAPASEGLPSQVKHHLPSKPGFRNLFNGTDLAGWHKNPAKIGHGTGGRWAVEQGVITGEQDPPGSGNGGILLTDETFGDFEVRFQTKPDWGVDSGFFLRSTDKGECYQIMIDYYDGGNVGEIYREALDGMGNRTFQLYGIYQDPEKRILTETRAEWAKPDQHGSGGQPHIRLAEWPRIWKTNDWNAIQARVEGNPPTITTYLNDQFITKYKSDKKFESVLGDRGRLALQVHGGKHWPEGAKVRFRNIQVQELHLP